MEGPQLAEVLQRQQEEIQRLRQELEAVSRRVPVPGPEAVPLPPDGEDYKLREAILRSVPKFFDDGKSLFRDHEIAVQKFLLCRTAVVQGDEFKKTILLESLAGKAVGRIRDNSTVDECYRSGTYEQFSAIIRELFCPDSESMLVRTEFQSYFQGKNQDVQSYLTNKLALYKLAFGPNERSFNTVMLHVIRGLCNHSVRRQVRRANPKDEAALRLAVVEATAAERDAYNGGYGESTSADGLITVSSARRAMGGLPEEAPAGPVPMEVDAVQGKERECYRCHRRGHLRKDCRAKRTLEGKEIVDRPRGKSVETKGRENGARKKRCFTCQKPGHLAKECRSLKQQTNALDEELDLWEEEEEAVSFLVEKALCRGAR